MSLRNYLQALDLDFMKNQVEKKRKFIAKVYL